MIKNALIKMPSKFNFPAHLITEEMAGSISDAERLSETYKRVGMIKKAKKVLKDAKINIVATICKNNGYSLIQFNRGVDTANLRTSFMTGFGKIKEISSSGRNYDEYLSHTYVYLHGTLFRRQKLSNYKGDVPESILNSMPDDLAKKAFVFKAQKRRDPIVAIPTKIFGIDGRYYIALYQWD